MGVDRRHRYRMSGSAQMVDDAGAPVVPGRSPDRHFKYVVVAPAVFLLLLIGLFPLIYSLIKSFQHITMLEEDTSFAGLANYVQLFHDARLWQALLHTAIITAGDPPLLVAFRLLIAPPFLPRLP